MQVAVAEEFANPAVPMLTYESAGLPDRRALLDAITQMLFRVIPCDAVGWNAVDKRRGVAELDGQPANIYNDPEYERVLAELDDHPMILSYLATPHILGAPRRMSDLIGEREFRRTRTYADLFRPLRIRHALTILTRSPTPESAGCWTFAREGSDFSDDEASLARAIQPMLVVLDQQVAEAVRDVTSADDQYRLTHREREVLALVAQGMTATSCGLALRISAGTIRKHLEHVYDKLDCHDRLLAVDRARKLGIIR
jgi:DNA-binding CsgD family transcriptional regulator